MVARTIIPEKAWCVTRASWHCIRHRGFIPGLSLLELRVICNAETNDANPKELPVAAGAKIAAGIARVMWEHDIALGRKHELFIEL
jgi:hypothetical protein